VASASVTMVATAETASVARASVTVPMPPTVTSQFLVSCKGIGHRAHAADWDIPVPHVIRALQHKDPAASPGQIGRAGQPVVPGPHKAVVIVIDALADEGNG